VGYNQYSTRETMVFDDVKNPLNDLSIGKNGEEKLYSRTAQSEGEMFGLSEYLGNGLHMFIPVESFFCSLTSFCFSLASTRILGKLVCHR
jgi:hypothetical protein